MRQLKLPASVARELRENLICEDEQERFAFVYCGESGADLLAGRVVTVPDEAMARQSRTACRPDPETEREHVESCYRRHLTPVLSHSHPFAETPRFSSIDIESMDRFRQWLTGLFSEESFGFAVVGRRGIQAVADGENGFDALGIEVVGDWKLDETVPGSTSRFASSDESEPESADRFDRNVRAVGERGQARIQQATVGLVGVGGLGSIVAEQLARLGVQKFVLIDPDVVEESNLSRLVGAYDHHVGKPKVTAVREHLWRSAPGDVTVETYTERVQECSTALDSVDLLVGCVDTVTARSYCNEYAVKQLQYYVDAGVRIETADDRAVSKTGYIHLVAPGSTACFDCLGRHDQEAARLEQLSPEEQEAERERGYIDDEALTPEPALVHLNGLCASKTVSVLVDLVTGCSPPDFVRYEDTTNEMTELTTSPSSACPTCGEDGVLGVGRREFGDAQFAPQEPASTD